MIFEKVGKRVKFQKICDFHIPLFLLDGLVMKLYADKMSPIHVTFEIKGWILNIASMVQCFNNCIFIFSRIKIYFLLRYHRHIFIMFRLIYYIFTMSVAKIVLDIIFLALFRYETDRESNNFLVSYFFIRISKIFDKCIFYKTVNLPKSIEI